MELHDISQPQRDLCDQIKEGLQHDSLTQTIVYFVKEGKIQRFWVKDGLLLTKGKRIYVPSCDNRWRKIMKDYHDSKWACHPGMHRRLTLTRDFHY